MVAYIEDKEGGQGKTLRFFRSRSTRVSRATHTHFFVSLSGSLAFDPLISAFCSPLPRTLSTHPELSSLLTRPWRRRLGQRRRHSQLSRRRRSRASWRLLQRGPSRTSGWRTTSRDILALTSRRRSSSAQSLAPPIRTGPPRGLALSL